ncbi:MAG: DUF4446 family protein [Candidatus Sungiibacteriota bacterium]|uniref:DUF4446 family protein n=1 Tax=Candidatus Sungiibacteriota bacterium TaxID=2750080 RepID=A0A7T5RJY0_9BACT|nr:MAG: DUF4446 family protein [Candidatus Sungbacteria bacterium]
MNIFFVIAIFALTGVIVLGWFFYDLRKKVLLLFGGKETKSGTETLQELVRRVTKTEIKIEELEPRLKLTEEISQISVQKVGFLRFNPFQDTGGDNSFVVVMLDRENNGIVISSLYMREGVRIYAKKVERGKTQQPLSGEEKRVLEEAIKK